MRRFAIARQRGIATLMAVLFLLFVIGVTLVIALQMAGSDVYDSAAQNQSVEALFLAESAIERTAQRLSGTACASLGTEGPINLGSGSFSVVTPAPYVDSGLCRVRVTGSVGKITRTVDSWFSGGGGTIAIEAAASNGSSSAVNTLTTVPALTVGGPGRVLVVGITVDTASGSNVSNVTYAGQPLTFQRRAGSNPLTELWMLVNPPAGTGNVVVTLAPGSDQMAVGALVFTGVDLATPVDVPLQATTGNGKTAGITIAPVTSNAWVVDVVSVNGGVTLTMGGPAGRTLQWDRRLGGSVTGAGSTFGPVSPAWATTLQWTWGGNNRSWSQVAVALRPTNSPQLMRWSEVVP